MPDRFTAWRSFHNAQKLMSDADALSFLRGMFNFVFEGDEGNLTPIAEMAFALTKPNLESSIDAIDQGSKGGMVGGKLSHGGGAPVGNQNAKKQQTPLCCFDEKQQTPLSKNNKASGSGSGSGIDVEFKKEVVVGGPTKSILRADPPVDPEPPTTTHLFQKIQETLEACGAHLDRADCLILADQIDPAWLEGDRNFIAYSASRIQAEYKRGTPEQHHRLFRDALLGWERYRRDYQAWIEAPEGTDPTQEAPKRPQAAPAMPPPLDDPSPDSREEREAILAEITGAVKLAAGGRAREAGDAPPAPDDPAGAAVNDEPPADAESAERGTAPSGAGVPAHEAESAEGKAEVNKNRHMSRRELRKLRKKAAQVEKIQKPP